MLRSAAVLLAGLALLLLIGCGKERDQDLGSDYPAVSVLTTISAVHAWTAALLDGIDEPILADSAILIPNHQVTPSQERRLRTAQTLVAWGGELDENAVAAYVKYTGESGRVVYASPGDTDDHFDWLDPARAQEAVSQLASELRRLYPENAGAISVNEERLLEEIRASSQRSLAMLNNVRGGEVLLDDDRLLPFVRYAGLVPAGVLSYVPGRTLTPEEVQKFHREIDRFSTAVMLITNQQSPAVLEKRTHVRFVYIDPIISGYVGPRHYQDQLERNALMVTAALAAQPPKKIN